MSYAEFSLLEILIEIAGKILKVLKVSVFPSAKPHLYFQHRRHI
jgi:hypothetical protein